MTTTEATRRSHLILAWSATFLSASNPLRTPLRARMPSPPLGARLSSAA
jgi:hypothetical protein